MNTLFSYDNLVHAISGGCGSAVAMSTFYPLDTVRTRIQLQKKNSDEQNTSKESETVLQMLMKIYNTEGTAGLYKGLVPVIQSLYCSNFVYFYSFHGLKKIVNPQKSALNDLLCGMTAGIVNVMSTTPLWVVNTRIKMQDKSQKAGNRYYSGIADGLSKVYRQEGIAGLWAGCGSSLILVINPAIQFMVYEAMKRYLIASTGEQPNSLLLFLVGATAKAIATTFTYPLQLAQTRQRHGGSQYSMLKIWAMAIAQDGPSGLFKGLNAKLLQTVLTAALMFLCYEKISSTVFTVLAGRKATVPSKH